MVTCRQCSKVFHVIGDALSEQLDTTELLEMAAQSITRQFDLKACHFRLLSRDLRTLEDVASFGLSKPFLDKGPVDAERSVAQALSGEAVGVLDCVSDPRVQYPEAFESEGIASMLTIPLEARGQVIGVMRIFTGTPRDFTDVEIEFFKVVALFCTGAIIDSMFHQILTRVTQAIRTTLDLPEVLDSIVRVVCEDLRSLGCAIHLVDSTNARLEARASYGLETEFVSRLAGSFSKEVEAEVLEGRSVAIDDACTDNRVIFPDLMSNQGVATVLLIPLVSRKRVIGVLSIYTHKTYQFSDHEKQLMGAIAEQCSLAIDNAKMFEALRQRYENLVDEFQMWFEHSQAYPQRGPTA